MQRPRLTDRTAEAIDFAIYNLRIDIETLASRKTDPARGNLERAVEYLEDLLRWHRARGAASK